MKTILCVPGHDERKIARCRDFGADKILFDLEDAVPEDRRAEALSRVLEAALAGDAVRLPPGWGFGLLEQLVSDGVEPWIPKARPTRSAISGAVPIIETPHGVLELYGEMQCAGIAFGGHDFLARSGGPSRLLADHARALVVMAAAAAGVPAYDSPCYTLREVEQWGDYKIARDLGFQWKGCWHPEQVQLIKAFTAAESPVEVPDGEGAVMVGDDIVGPPTRLRAQRLAACA